MINPFPKPKEIVMSLIVVVLTGTFCYLAIEGNEAAGEGITPQALKEVFIYVLGVYSGGKLALAGSNGTGSNGTGNDGKTG